MVPSGESQGTRPAALTFSEEQIRRYSRHIILPEVGGRGQRKLLNSKVLLIGATNHPQLLDEAAWRRFDEVIPFDLPDIVTRELILRRLLVDSTTECDIRKVAENTENFSGADLKMLVREAILSALIDGRTEPTCDDLTKGELLITARDENKARNWY